MAEMHCAPVLRESVLPVQQLPAKLSMMRSPLAVGSGSGEGILLGILTYGAIRRKARWQLCHALPQAYYPVGREAVCVTGVEQGDHLLFQERVESLGFGCIPGRIVVVLLRVS